MNDEHPKRAERSNEPELEGQKIRAAERQCFEQRVRLGKLLAIPRSR
jgi:hypothetical protein